MAVNIPIWPGSSSFCPGETPFGFYDQDTDFRADADKVAVYCARKLGYPVVDIELQDINFYSAFEEAVTEFSNQVNQFNVRDNLLLLQGMSTGSDMTGKRMEPTFDTLFKLSDRYGTEVGAGGSVTYRSGSISILKDVQRYDLNTLYRDVNHSGEVMEIKRIYHNAPPAIVKYFDPYVGTGLGSQQMLENFGWGSYSPGISFLMMPMYADILRLQAIEFNDTIRKSQYSFQLINNELRIFPKPTYNYTLWFDYILKSDRSSEGSGGLVSDISNAPYSRINYKYITSIGRQWIYRYAASLAKEMLGHVRNKYSSIPIPDGDVTLNGGDLVSEAQNEKETLITELRETLDETTRNKQLAKQKEEAELLQEQLSKIPNLIYIG